MIPSLWAALRASVSRRPPPAACRDKLLVVVEGKHDVEFLRRVSRILHADDAHLPDLSELEQRGRLVFVPFGGGDILGWTDRLAGLGQREFHLYDREAPPETAIRQRAAAIVNARPDCRAFVTRKRSLENYLSPRAIYETRGVEIRFSDDDHIADLAARYGWSLLGREPAWESLPARARKRLRERAKRWLNTAAVERMTVERIDQCDPQGEIRVWLRTMARLVRPAR
ncbi:MAG TPA: ATP-dependent endonuclease [Pirellulales bacterium]|nr:ATP-dependent endonuclease [Pirellulales bacterium]